MNEALDRETLLYALQRLANWSLPRWEPDNPQTEGEQMRLYAMRVLDAVLDPRDVVGRGMRLAQAVRDE